jgi:hypothetical protein
MAAFSVGAIGFLNVINMDMQIAKAKPGVDGRDYFYIAHLSADAYPAWQETEQAALDFYNSIYQKSTLTDEEQKQLATFRIAVNILDEQAKRLEGMKENVFFWNWSQGRALKGMGSESRMTRSTCVKTGIDRLVIALNLSNVASLEWDRMNNYEYPFTVRTFGENFSYNPKYEDDIYNQILTDNEELGKEFDAKFGSYNRWDFRTKLNQNPEWKAKFQPFTEPQACAL